MTEPSIFQTGQYLLDLSFENFALNTPVVNPAIQMNVNVDARALSGAPEAGAATASGDYESVLVLNVSARDVDAEGKPDAAAKPLFIIEMHYAARYRVANVPLAELEPFLLIEAPRLLFPFARQVAADAVAHGGLPPLLLAPIDFGALYQQQRQAA
jgi:preprotein translocase subunit SecB